MMQGAALWKQTMKGMVEAYEYQELQRMRTYF